VSNSDQVETLFEKISELYKDEKVPSIIVNCAGIFILSKLIDTTEETFDKIVNINLKGPF
jgi:NAD(P)-dependent dehydrogenase (short-subunit alcohol dehydrogenase family)